MEAKSIIAFNAFPLPPPHCFSSSFKNCPRVKFQGRDSMSVPATARGLVTHMHPGQRHYPGNGGHSACQPQESAYLRPVPQSVLRPLGMKTVVATADVGLWLV